MLARRLGVTCVEEFAEEFVESRAEAERRARRRIVREEVRLDEIWEDIATLLGPEKLSGVDGPALELEAERATLCPVQAMRERIAAERTAGCGILFISDSCLPASFLSPLLHGLGFAAEGDRLYISSEVGLTKATGTLFTHVLKTENLAPSRLHHIGNDPMADVAVPKRLGIRAERFTEARRKTIERLILRRRPPAAGLWLATAGALRAARLALPHEPGPKEPAVKLVEQFLGPFLCTFGHWLLRRAAADGVERLYFASRDTRLLWSVCRILAQPGPHPTDLRYLLVSRQAVLLPAIFEITPTRLAWLRRDFGSTTLPRLLAKFELNYEDCVNEWHIFCPKWKRDAEVTTALDWAIFWKFLGSPLLRARIHERAELRRKNARDYFAAQGLLDPVSSGFIDLGWFLSCQAGLNRIRGEAAKLPPLHGYYLALKRFRFGPAEAGPTSAVFREVADDLPVPAHHAWMWRNYLIDQIVGLAAHPSVQAYGPDGKVEFASGSQAIGTEAFRRIEQAVTTYATAFGSCWESLASDDSQVAQFLGTLLGEFFAHPSPSCVEALRGILFSPNQGSGGLEPLIEPYSWREVLSSWMPANFLGLPKKPAARRWWPEASAAVTPPLRRMIHRRVNPPGNRPT